MRPLPPDIPRWPPIALAWVFLGVWVSAAVAGFVTVLVLSLCGADGLTPAGVLLFAALSAVGSLAALRRITGCEPAQLGLRPTPARAAAVGLAIAVAVLAVVVAVTDPFSAPHIPRELSQQGALSRALGDPDSTIVALGPGAVASVATRALIGMVLAQVLLVGFALPVLARSLGLVAGTAIVAVVSAGLLPGAPVAGVVLGALACWLYTETGSIAPGTGLASATAAAVLAGQLGAGVPGALAAGLACGAVAGALALGGPTPVWDLRPRPS